jgi:predicted MPP superfamily phosphohydrolase
MLTLVYLIPNIYVFVRIWQLFIIKGSKLYFTLIYLVSALIYPISNLISEGNAGFPASVITGIADYLLPFYLYLFLFVLAFDIILLINKIFKFISKETLNTSLFKSKVLTVILALSAVVVIAGVINFNTIRTSEYRITVPGKSSHISHLKIAFVADFHLQESVNVSFVERFAEKIAAINPDIMIFGGDIVEGDREDENMVQFEKLISEIKTKYGVYAVLGNHEFYAGQDKKSFFDKAGMKVLCDTIVVIDSSFSLAGRYDSHFKIRKPIGELLKPASSLLPLILVDHRPTEVDEVSLTAVDVQLSGHTHNGQLFPINFITGKVYKLSWGLMKEGNTSFFVTSGIRLWGPPVRTTGKSEIMVIDITFSGL